jgi:hypothetical protein
MDGNLARGARGSVSVSSQLPRRHARVSLAESAGDNAAAPRGGLRDDPLGLCGQVLFVVE